MKLFRYPKFNSRFWWLKERRKYLHSIKKGELLNDKFPKGAKRGTNNREIVKSENMTLQSVGISRNESSNARLIFEGPDEFDPSAIF
jgi:hypothetical protein